MSSLFVERAGVVYRTRSRCSFYKIPSFDSAYLALGLSSDFTCFTTLQCVLYSICHG